MVPAIWGDGMGLVNKRHMALSQKWVVPGDPTGLNEDVNHGGFSMVFGVWGTLFSDRPM